MRLAGQGARAGESLVVDHAAVAVEVKGFAGYGGQNGLAMDRGSNAGTMSLVAQPAANAEKDAKMECGKGEGERDWTKE